MPSFRSGRVVRPRSAAIRTSSPTPSVSSDDERDRAARMPCARVGAEEARRRRRATEAEGGLRQIVGAEAEELGASRRSRRRAAPRAAARSSCRRDRRASTPAPCATSAADAVDHRLQDRRAPSRVATSGIMISGVDRCRRSPASPRPPPRRSRAPASRRSRDR